MEALHSGFGIGSLREGVSEPLVGAASELAEAGAGVCAATGDGVGDVTEVGDAVIMTEAALGDGVMVTTSSWSEMPTLSPAELVLAAVEIEPSIKRAPMVKRLKPFLSILPECYSSSGSCSTGAAGWLQAGGSARPLVRAVERFGTAERRKRG